MSAKDWVWLIDDDEQLADILSLSLEAQGYGVRVSRSAEEVLALLQDEQRLEGTSIALLDLRLAGQDGLTLLPAIRDALLEVPILVITAHGDVDSAVGAFTLGANGYIRKPFAEDELALKIRQAIDRHRLGSGMSASRREADAGPGGSAPPLAELIPCRDFAMLALLKRVELAAAVTSTCVISGESGTGKELVARALHLRGPRREGPLVAFNCAALPEALMESELFGHAKGAFTDAREAKPGLFARARGGTIFLDEIGDAPLSIQAKLLRVLQEREVLPLGSATPVKVDVRVVAATHKSLKAEVEQKRFRQDLYYRLHVVQLKIPPLRERPKDIPFLASLFAGKLSREMGLPFRGFTALAQSGLESYRWPGNVRELQNRIEQAIALGGEGVLRYRNLFPEREPLGSAPQGLAAELDDGNPQDPALASLPSYQEAKISFERKYLERVLSAAKGNIAKAARMAAKSRTEVYGLLRKHGLNPGRFKGEADGEKDV